MGGRLSVTLLVHLLVWWMDCRWNENKVGGLEDECAPHVQVDGSVWRGLRLFASVLGMGLGCTSDNIRTLVH
ncbi:hypothetical protein Tco_1176410, partial [Tanacetum coccineum]